MTPAARLQSAIEVLDLILTAATDGGASGDKIVGDWFRSHRFAGSKDRRAVRELVFAAIRACGPVPASGRAAMLRLAQSDPALAALFDGSHYGPQPLAPGEPAGEGGTAPQWLEQRLRDSGIEPGDWPALLERAPLDIRLNPLRGEASLPEPGEALHTPQGLRYPSGTQVEQWDAFQAGLIEVQDAGSQLACLAVGAQPGETVIDLCAGGGGKTLTLAAAMGNKGRLVACDVDRARLSRLGPRAERAGIAIIEERLLNPGHEAEALADLAGKADAVLVDAPCSGTGTWRRNPEARWRLSPAELQRVAALQARLADLGAALVRPGGRLVFVTCSLLDEEGADQAEAFLQRHPDWRAVAPDLPAGTLRGGGVRLTPARDATDGFFIARFVSP
ncbi:RsmB/NOP family class I SAM-dependent RNA methyltransferase [Novosphingobium sp.]|uniref:RsmB/NOP family class I SAM-dependent RNA methyltransferase n=1 Tax=Novosphingobium sp. TaxID=1874826 RepID=UPI00286ABEA4|nr:RsmB/NOP family class I SAM-dependent RNA methyltransferase [Novosphingobium sp.]